MISNLGDEVGSIDILDIYRFRWQVELYFKRLKSIMDFGELPKRRDGSIMSWLHGKLMVALLLEKMLGKVNISPCGECQAEHLAKDEIITFIVGYKYYRYEYCYVKF